MPALFLKIRGAQELEANALKEVVLGSDTNSFVLPAISENRPAVPFSGSRNLPLGCEIIMTINLKPSGHEMGPIFHYLGHGAAVGYSRGCPCEYWTLP